MVVIGLTGSIGMGKSTTAGLFRELGAPVQDADAVVAELYGAGGAAVQAIAAMFPDAVVGGAADRGRLSALVLGRPEALAALEAAVHPLVQAERERFLARAEADGAAAAVVEVQLLLEVGADRAVDAVVVVTAPPEVQRERALARPGMTADKLARILARQMPDAEKNGPAPTSSSTPAGGSTPPAPRPRESWRRCWRTAGCRGGRGAEPAPGGPGPSGETPVWRHSRRRLRRDAGRLGAGWCGAREGAAAAPAASQRRDGARRRAEGAR